LRANADVKAICQKRRARARPTVSPNLPRWNHERNLGIAAQSRRTVERLLEAWIAGGEGRWVDAIEQREHPLSSPEESQVWWRSKDEDEDEEK
jgi:hypothetical protein